MTAATFQMKSDLAIDHIKLLITSGRAPPGTRITTRAVAQALRISDTPVREAIRALVTDEWLVLRPHVGAVVADLGGSGVREIYAIRARLGALAIELGAPRYDHARMDQIDDVLHASGLRLGEPAAFAALDQRLHALLTDTPETTLIYRILIGLDSRTERLRRGHRVAPRRLRESHAEHVAIRDAIAAGDIGCAARLLGEHEQASGAALLTDVEAAPAEHLP